MTYTVHDSGYTRLLSNRTIFRQLIETFVHEDWVKDLDFSQAETLDKSFVSDHYKETESARYHRIINSQGVHLLGAYSPKFRYCKLVEHEYSKEELLKIRNLVSTIKRKALHN